MTNQDTFDIICYLKFIRGNFKAYWIGKKAKELLEQIKEDGEDSELKYVDMTELNAWRAEIRKLIE